MLGDFKLGAEIWYIIKKIHLYICHINIVLLQEADELPEILHCWTVMTTIGPYNLNKMQMNINLLIE